MSQVTCAKCFHTGPAGKVRGGSGLVTVALVVLGIGGLFYFMSPSHSTTEFSAQAGSYSATATVTGPASSPPSMGPIGLGELGIILLLVLSPALAYEFVGRSRASRPACAKCKSEDVLPADSP